MKAKNNMKNDIYEYYRFNTFDYNKYSLKKYQENLEIISEKVWNFFIEDAKKYGFEERVGQQDMALDIVDALKNKENIIIEAGVGIGKSFAYIVPLLYYNKLFRKPVAIATSTITLQEQLLNDIKTISKLTGIDIDIVLAKGQTHFICKLRVDEYIAKKTNKSILLDKIFNLSDDRISDRKDFPFSIGNEIWNNINVCDLKRCKNCQYIDDCYFRNLRDEMLNTTGILLCNQDLLTVHLQKKKNGQRLLFNNDISVIVIDEAHNLEEKVRNSLTKGLSKDEIIKTANQIVRIRELADTDIYLYFNQMKKHLGELYNCFNIQITEQINSDPYNMKYADRFFLELNPRVIKLFDNVYMDINEIYNLVGMFYNERNIESINIAIDNFESIHTFFSSFIKNKNKFLIWLEKNKSIINLITCPKNINEVTKELYFDNDHISILTSATLTNQKTGNDAQKYSYLMKNIGFIEKEGKGFLSTPKVSPFPYDKHSMIYFNGDLPHPTNDRDKFIEQGVDIVVKLLKITNGKALLLFTAKVDMEEVYKKLIEYNLPYEILIQNNTSSQEQILSNFKNNENSILLGTGAYWEGINIEGKSLSNIIIFRLPFPVPDPVIKYKSSISSDPLMEVNVPEMIIKLNQGIGRLIRNYTDKGIVAILDPRIGLKAKSRYKEIVWNSIPIRNKTDNLDVLKDFYDEISKNDF